MATRNIRIAVSCVVFICLLYGYLFLLSGTTTASDLNECVDIVNAVKRAHHPEVNLSAVAAGYFQVQ